MQEKYKYLRFFTKLIFSILLGISISFVITQNSDDFKKFVQEKLTLSLQKSLKCKVECQVGSINLFVPKIELNFLKVEPNNKVAHIKNDNSSENNNWNNNNANNNFGWECRPIEIGFSWVDFMLGGVIDIYVDIQDLKINSKLKIDSHGWALLVWPSIAALFEGSSIEVPTLLQSLSVKRGEITIKEEKLGHAVNGTFASITKNICGNYRTKISFFSGDMTLYSKNLFDRFSGSVGLDIYQKAQKLYICLDGKSMINLKFLNSNKLCFVSGKWADDQGFFDITSQDRTLTISPIKVYSSEKNLNDKNLNDKSLFVDLGFESFITDLSDLLFSKQIDFTGKCCGKLCLEFGSFGFGATGDLKLEDLKYKDLDICSLANLSFKNNKENHAGSLSILRSDGLAVSGNFNYDINKNNFSCDLVNESEIIMPVSKYWKVLPKKAKLKVANYINNVESGFIGSCVFCANNKSTNSILKVLGELKFLDNIFSATGKVGDKKYELSLFTDPVINLKKLIYCNSSGKPEISINSLENDDNKFNGLIKFPIIKSFIKDYFDYELQGQGELGFYGFHKKDNFLLELNFQNGSVNFPNFYNFLNSFKIRCKIDPYKKIIVSKNSIINLHKGFVTCKKAVMQFDSDFNPVYIYAPFIFNNCFVNLKSDLFASISGRMLLSKNKNSCPNLQGLAVIERAHMKKNIFSPEERRKYFKVSVVPTTSCFQDCTCDISVITKDPVRINTDFINTSANLDLVIKNKIFDPQLSGKIDFISGSLAFPYKPLNITKGSMYFFQNQTLDPLIELTASNKINKYNITMDISGSLQNYNISFDSSPPLSEEQIIALLMAGSVQESLNLAAPALIMQSLKDSLFGSSGAKSSDKNYFGKFLKPFKNVRLVPSFVDQSGRGGLRGTLEVDINDRTRASVQKNFSLSEDTRFELEYLLSDDVSARGVRRENGDIGGEVEMRWKF